MRGERRDRRSGGTSGFAMRLAVPLAFGLLILARPCTGFAQSGSASGAARVRVRGPGAGTVERAIARVLEQHGYKVVKGRRKPAALRVEGRLRSRSSARGSGSGAKRSRVTVRLTVKQGNGDIVGGLRVRASSPRAAARRVERELWPKIARSLAAAAPRHGAAAWGDDADGAGDDDAADDEVDAGDDDGAEAGGSAARATVAVAAPAPAPDRTPPVSEPARSRGRRGSAASRRRVATAGDGDTSVSARASSGASSSAAGVSASVPGPGERDAAQWLSISVGPELYGRHFSYRDDIFELLREYDLTATPALGATAELYPMAGRSRGPLAGLGAAGRFTHVQAFDSEDAAGGQYSGEARSYSVGGRYRHRVFGVELAGAVDFGGQSFSIAPVGDAPDPDFPAVRYRYLRAGLSAAAPVWSRFALAASAGYRHILASGQIESASFFPRSSARGLDLELELRTALLWGVDLRAGAALERYGHALRPEPGDPRVAGGALDQYVRFFLRLGYSL